MAKGANKASRNPPSYLSISCFTVSLTPLINTPKYSNDFVVLIISFISSFEINKVSPFPALTVSFSLLFLPNLFISFEAKLLTNLDKLFLAKQIAIFVSVFFPKLANQEPKDSPDWVILIMSFTNFYGCWHIVSKGVSYSSCLSCW